MSARGRATSRLGSFAGLLASCALAAGCLGEPKIEDRWTRVDLEATTFTPGQPLNPASACSVEVASKITYRKIVTGYAVMELRASSAVTGAQVVLAPDAPRMRMAEDIDRILPNSVSLGRVVRPITGWDHLIQRFDMKFGAQLPAATDSSGMPVSVFLLTYLGSGEKIERPNQPDTVIVTPFVSTDMEILPVGMPVVVTGMP